MEMAQKSIVGNVWWCLYAAVEWRYSLRKRLIAIIRRTIEAHLERRWVARAGETGSSGEP